MSRQKTLRPALTSYLSFLRRAKARLRMPRRSSWSCLWKSSRSRRASSSNASRKFCLIMCWSFSAVWASSSTTSSTLSHHQKASRSRPFRKKKANPESSREAAQTGRVAHQVSIALSDSEVGAELLRTQEWLIGLVARASTAWSTESQSVR